MSKDTELQRRVAINDFQYRLVLLNHTSTCCRSIRCRTFPQCEETKQLLSHLESCTDPACEVKHCLSSRYLLHHHSICLSDSCEVCKPLNEVKTRKCSRAKSIVVVRDLNRKRSFNEVSLQYWQQSSNDDCSSSGSSVTSSDEDHLSPRFQRSRNNESSWEADTVSSKSPLLASITAEEEPTLPLSWLSEQIYANLYSDQPLLCFEPMMILPSISRQRNGNCYSVEEVENSHGNSSSSLHQEERKEEEAAALNALLEHIHQLN